MLNARQSILQLFDRFVSFFYQITALNLHFLNLEIQQAPHIVVGHFQLVKENGAHVLALAWPCKHHLLEQIRLVSAHFVLFRFFMHFHNFFRLVVRKSEQVAQALDLLHVAQSHFDYLLIGAI